VNKVFKFLKEKLKSAINKFSKDVETEDIDMVPVPEIEPPEEIIQEPEQPKELPKEEPEPEELKEEVPEVVPEPIEPEEAPKEPVVKEEPKQVIPKKPLVEEPHIKESEPPKQEELIPKELKVEKPSTETLDFEPEITIPKDIEPARVEEPKIEEPEKKGLFHKIKERVTKKALSEDKFDKLFWELEVVLLENNVAMDVIDKLKTDLKQKLVASRLSMGKTQEIITDTLSETIDSLFTVEAPDLVKEISKKQPYVILFAGVNGVGKTTTIAKVAHFLQKQKFKCVMAAADTFRAAAIQQLEAHANKLGVKIIKHDYGSDPAAVAFDAIKYAQAKQIDAVLVDTAGRQHSNVNLIEEMKKINRVAKPDLKIFVGESLTGNDCIEQAKQFNEAIGIDAIILTKTDVDEKGGTAVSISYITKKPIIYLGTGQEYDNLEVFHSDTISKSLGLA